MRSENHINNAYISKDKTIFAFDPKNEFDVPVKMIDKECNEFDIWLNKYRNHIQSIRMISCKKKNVWAPQPEKWSIAAIGMDYKNRVLFPTYIIFRFMWGNMSLIGRFLLKSGP